MAGIGEYRCPIHGCILHLGRHVSRGRAIQGQKRREGVKSLVVIAKWLPKPGIGGSTSVRAGLHSPRQSDRVALYGSTGAADPPGEKWFSWAPGTCRIRWRKTGARRSGRRPSWQLEKPATFLRCRCMPSSWAGFVPRGTWGLVHASGAGRSCKGATRSPCAFVAVR